MIGNVEVLFRPLQIGELQLRNRIVMPAMTRNRSPGNIPGEKVLEYYRRRAKSVGMIVTEGTCINHPAANAYRDVPFIYGEGPLEGWKRIVDAVHAEGARIVAQLWHTGSARHPGASPDPQVPAFTPSGLTQKFEPLCHAMTESDIADVIDAFATAAADARGVGFDGVEIHGAHGYLIDEFFWEKSNLRQDRYGGTLANRGRFAAEIISAVRERVGPAFPVIFRWSQWKQHDYNARLVHDPAALEAFIAPLVDAGADVLHCSTRRYWQPEFEGSNLNLAGWVKKISGKPTIAVGNVGMDADLLSDEAGRIGYRPASPATLDDLLERLEREEFDLVAVGRALLANEDWADIIRNQDYARLRPFSKDLLRDLH
ncbi:MAG: NADH:flavin oxidoreductase [Hyphomonadaceae bacterium]|nr:NADH:flavin oxidoreductase [Hyphomonadaceae bacterium]